MPYNTVKIGGLSLGRSFEDEKKKKANILYRQQLNDALNATYGYAQQGNDQAAEVADTLLSGMTQRKTGDIATWDWDTARQTEIDRAQAIDYFRGTGLFDVRSNATNKGLTHLTSVGFLNDLLPTLDAEIAVSKQKDADWANGGEAAWYDYITRESAIKNKLADMEAQGRNYYDTDVLEEADLLWLDKVVNGNEAWKPNYASQQDVDRYNSLVDQWAETDWDAFDLAQHMGITAPTKHESKTAALESARATAAGEIERRKELEAMQAAIRSDANYGSLSAYEATPYTNPDRVKEAYVKGYDELIRFMNSDASWAAKTVAGEHSLAVQGYMDKGYDYLTPDELADYNVLYNSGRLDEAARYLDLLSPELLYRRAMVMQSYTEAKATNPYLAVPSWVDARINNVTSVLNIPQQVIEAWTGNDNPYSSAWDEANKVAWTGEAQLGAIANMETYDWVKTAAEYGYKGVTGAADNAMRLVAGGFNPTASLIIAGLQSGSSSLQESASRDDMSGAAKIVKAIGTAAIEVGTEKIGLDALFSMGKSGALQYLKNVILSEMGEESLNYVSGEALEGVVAFLFDHEAEIKSGPEFWQGLTDTAITTMISAALMGAGGATSQALDTRATGKAISASGDVEGMVAFAKELDKSSAAYTDAVNIEETLKGGKKPKLSELGMMAKHIEEAIGAEHAATTNAIVEKAIENRLVELGTNSDDAKKNAAAVRKLAAGETLSAKDRASVAWDHNATQVVKEMTRDVQDVDGDRPGVQWRTKYEAELKDANQKTAGKQVGFARTLHADAAGKAAKAAASKGKSMVNVDHKLSSGEVAYTDGKTNGRGKIAKFVEGGEEGLRVVVELATGETEAMPTATTNGAGDETPRIVTELAHGETVTMPVKSISGAGDEGLGAVVAYIQNDGAANKHRDLTAEEANTMLNVYGAVGGNAQDFIQDFESSYLSGYAGIENAPATTNKQVSDLAYNYGKEAAQKDEANRAKVAGKAGTGATMWIGKATSSEQVGKQTTTETLEQAKERMTESQRTTVRIAEALAEKMKIDIAFFESDANHVGEIENGSFIPGTNQIYIDINSGANSAEALDQQGKKGTLGYAVLRTLGHELTHYMEANTPDGYAAYKQAVKNALKAKNLDWAKLVRAKIDAAIRQGQKLTIKGAEAEVIADASEYMLQDSKFIKELDTSTVSKIKTFIQNFMENIKSIFTSLGGGHVESNVLRGVYDGLNQYTKELQDLWDAGMELAIERVQGGEASTEAVELSDVNTQYSIREEAPPKKTGIAYKVFFEKNGKLYPPMVANPGGADTPVGVWLNADVGTAAPPSKTGRLQVKAGGKGTQGGSGSLAFRPGWHLGDIPKATQFNRLNKATGVKELFPYNFVWAECEYAMDVDYQEEAMSYGYNANGKFQHSLAGLPRLPENGYYHYRTNPDPNTVPWVITGAMKVNKILSRAEVDEILREKGVEPTKWQGPDGEQMEADGVVKQFSRRGDYQYTVDGAYDFFEDAEIYHHFAQKASNTIAKAPGKKQHVISVTHHEDDVYMCVVQNEGNRKFRLEDVAFLDVSEYNGRISELTTAFERMYLKYGKERTAKYIGGASADVRGRFFPIDRRRGIGPIVQGENRSGEGHGFGKTGRTVGSGDQRRGLFESGREVKQTSLRDAEYMEAVNSGDPMTYDDNGNVIPLSERFDWSNEDIRYSLRGEVVAQAEDSAHHPAEKQFSIRQLAESLGYDLRMVKGSDIPYEIVDANGKRVVSFTAEQIKNTPIGGLIDAARSAGNIDPITQQEQLKMIADLATLAARYEDQAMVWEIAGSMLYSAIKNNSDKQYNKTVDFGTICSKTQAIIDVLSDTMLKLDRGLTREEVITAYNKTAKNGLSVPCGPCYVFSRWMGVPGLLNSMANYQRRFGKMTAAEVTEYIDGVQSRYSSEGERFSKVIGKQKTRLENRLESIASRMQRAMATGDDMTALFREADQVEREYADVEAYNWVTQVLCQNKRVGGAVEVLRDADGNVKLDPTYKPVPHSVLFDMRKTGEFAKYPKSWKYRSTRGAGMGKSILPYSGASLGDTVYGDQKRRKVSDNAFLDPTKTIAQRVRAIKNATKRMKSQNLIGGHRFQSTSDYRPEWGLDYIMTFLEMQAVGAKGQLYTKVIEAVDMFATAGIEVNLSIMANGDGWHYDRNGNKVIGVEDFSSVSGIDFKEALEKTRKYDNVQMILVGMNDDHIRLAMADDRITFIIPWHSSGSSEGILKQLFDAVGEELHTGMDYQEIQSDKPVAHATDEQKLNATVRKKIITGGYAKKLPTDAEMNAIQGNEFLSDLYRRFYLDETAVDTYGVKLSSEQASQVFPYEYWDTTLTYDEADENGRRFVRYCESIGLVPRFEKFKGDHGYWKLLIDRRMYNRDGTYHVPQTIDVTNVKIGDVASSVSQAKYGDPVKTGNAVMETIEEIRSKAKSPTYPEPDITDSTEGYGGEMVVEVNHKQTSLRDAPDEVSVRDYLMEADASVTESIEERNALTTYQKILQEHATASEAVTAAEAAMVGKTGDDLQNARATLAAARTRQKDLYNRLIRAENTPHLKKVLNRSVEFIRQEISGKTEEQIARTIAGREARINALTAELAGLKGAAKTQKEADIRAQERVVAQLKSKAAQSLLKMSKRYQQAMDEVRTRRDTNMEIAKKAKHIKTIVKKLNDRIVHEEDYKNVKEPLKPVVHNLVQTFIDGFGSLVFDSKTADRLKVVYDALAVEGNDAEWAYSDDVANWLQELAELSARDEERRMHGGSSMESVVEKLEIYEKVEEIAGHIYHLVKSADEMFVNGKRETFAQYSKDVGDTLVAKKDRKLLVGTAAKVQQIADDLIRRGNMIPTYFFESLKNSGLKNLFDGLMNGQTEYAQAILAGKHAVLEAKVKYNYYTWSTKPTAFRTQQGHDIALTVEQMMWVYATAKREASNTLMATHHLDQGGFKYDKDSLPKLNAFKAIPGSDRIHLLSAADVAKITDTLTAEQKAYADELVEYLSSDMAALGNKASMELFGIEKYNEKYYFPFKTASDQRYQRSDAGSASATNDARVRHSPFTHSLRKGANTTLVMGDFTDVVADHINLMSTYASFVVPIESMNRVLNHKVNDEVDGSGNEVSIRSLIARKHGESAQKYIADLLKDLNGGPAVDNRGSLSAFLRLFKKSAVAGSLSVAVQQPTAYIRAFGYIDPKYFHHLTGESDKKVWERALKYSGTAVIKDMGRFDVGMGKAADEWISDEAMEGFNIFKRSKFLLDQKGFGAAKDAWVDFLTALPGVMDRLTWTHIWKAVEAEQRDANPGMNHQSEEFYRIVGKRFDEVINHTQVYDSILSKSQNMRSKNAFAQMSTAFMSEPVLNANVYYSAARGEHTKAQRVRMVSSVVISNLFAAAAAAAISAWNDDDDKERTAIEKYMAAFAGRAVDNLNPLGMLPYISDVYDIFSGYDPERLDLSLIKDIADYGATFFEKLTNPEKEVTYRDVENFFGSVANMTGIPAKNWSRDIRRAVNLVFNTKHEMPTAANVKYGVYEEILPGWSDSGKAYCQRFVAALADGDKQEAYDLWEYMNGTKAVSKGSLETNIRAALKEYVRQGIITPEQATEVLRKYVPYKDDKNNVNKPKEWLKETE